MLLNQAKLGEKYECYLRQDGSFSIYTVINHKTTIGTVVGIENQKPFKHGTDRQILFLGWKEGEQPTNIKDNHSNKDWSCDWVSDISSYPYTYPVYMLCITEVIRKVIDDPVIQATPIYSFNCSKCNMLNPWAVSNQINGTYLCYECSNRWFN